MPKTLILAGGGHAHLATLAAVEAFVRRGHRVLLINPDPWHYYSGMGPGLLGGSYAPREVRFHVGKLVEQGGGEFVPGQVARIDTGARQVQLATGERLGFDVLSCNTGSGVLLPPGAAANQQVFPVKPIVRLWQLQRQLVAALATGAQRLLVVGGGPAGVETVGNLRQLVCETGGQADIRLATGRHGLLSGFPESLRRRAETALTQRRIGLMSGRVTSLAAGQAQLEEGPQWPFDFALVATGVQPSGLYRDSALAVGPDGALAVDENLQVPDGAPIFGGGDCIHFLPRPLAKVGVYAVRQGPVLRHNLLAALEGQPLRPFRPQPDYLLILNLGDGDGLLYKKGLVLEGRPAFAIKDWIDRRFMRRFQLAGELTEPDKPETDAKGIATP